MSTARTARRPGRPRLWPLVVAATLAAGCDEDRRPGRLQPDAPATAAAHSAASGRVHAVGLRTSAMDYHAAGQARPHWCWAACVQMALSARGIDLPQDRVLRRAFGDTGDLPGDVYAILRGLDGWEVSRGGRVVRLTATAGVGPPPLEVLARSLSEEVPVVVACAPAGGGVVGPAVVVTAAVYEDTPAGPRLLSVLVRDPDPVFAPDRGKRRLGPEEFARIEGYFYLTDAAAPGGSAADARP